MQRPGLYLSLSAQIGVSHFGHGVPGVHGFLICSSFPRVG